MADTILECVFLGKLNSEILLRWLSSESIEDMSEDCILLCCDKNEFVAYFLSYLRHQTDSILHANNNALQIFPHQSTPDKLLHMGRKHHRSISDPTTEANQTNDSLVVKTDHHRSQESPNRDRKKRSRVKTKLFHEDKGKEHQSLSSDESRISVGVDRLALSSTPMKNGIRPEFPSFTSPVTSHSRFKEVERCDTPRLGRHSRSQDKNISFGEYLINVQPKSAQSKKKKNSRNVSNETDDSQKELDLSNSDMFPEIGSRRSSSKRRIKPTNLDAGVVQKGFSQNSCFQLPSPLALEDNVAFRHQKLQPKELSNSFDVERNILKQEKDKLMEKFNTMNNTISPKPAVTQIKILQKEIKCKQYNFVKPDVCKVIYKDKLDVLVGIYDVLLKNNLILNVISEIYFLISLLLSKQDEDDYTEIDSQISDNNIINYLLRNIHNSTYFAVKSLWTQRVVLEVILDKNSLKTLGENKKVRSFYQDLAKFLLNSYGLKCEEENHQDRTRSVSETFSNGIVRFNLETDNADNFPSILSFQNFKKQRDMFYEILRGYNATQSSCGSRTSFRSRIKALLTCGQTAANYAHLAALFTAHMLSECLPPNAQESKLSKLHRRLTCPAAPESHRLPTFTDKENFYKEFIMYTENEIFRVHLRDALASEIAALDCAPITNEDRAHNSNQADISKEFLQLSKKLRLLAKFLGFLTSLPYSQVPTDLTMKTGSLMVGNNQREQSYVAPKDKVLENNIALRNYSQPTIDLKGMLVNAFQNGRLCITVPWIVHYLAMLDYTSLRIKYYKELIQTLFNIYIHRLKLIMDNKLKKNTIIFLKSILGWLFDLPHFPQEFYSENDLKNCSVSSEVIIDYCDIIDESILFELCPYLKDVGVLLSTCKVSQEQKELRSFRHITPVSLSLNPEDRIKNREKELQNRLEEEFLKSQPSSTRRVLEVVIERVTSGSVREISATLLTEAREKVREQAAKLVQARGSADNECLLKSLEDLYNEHTKQLREKAIETATSSVKDRTSNALSALLPSAPQPLQSLAVRRCMTRLNRWINENWNTTAILCKDIKEEMKTLITLGDVAVCSSHKNVIDVEAMLSPGPKFDSVHVSPAACIINLKEQICLMLDNDETQDLSSLLALCAASCSPNNVFARPPTIRAILQLSIDLCIVYVSRKPKEVNEDFLNKLHSIWDVCCPDRVRNTSQDLELPDRRDISPTFRNFEEDGASSPLSDDETETKCLKPVLNGIETKSTETKTCTSDTKAPTPRKNILNISNSINTTEREDCYSELLEFFDRILCPRNIVLLSASKCNSSEVWESLAVVLVYLLNNDYLSEESLTEQCLAVYTHEWPQSVQENLSTCMKAVSTRWSRLSVGKFTLILDFMAEYCRDMEYESFDCD